MGHGSVGLLFNGLIYGGLSTAADDYDEHRNSIISIILQKIENCSAFSDVYSVSEEVGGLIACTLPCADCIDCPQQ